MRLIDADALKEELNSWAVDLTKSKFPHYIKDDADYIIDNAPTIDAVPVVRCKDCKHCEYASNRIPTEQACVCYDVEQDWFCADGERRDDELQEDDGRN